MGFRRASSLARLLDIFREPIQLFEATSALLHYVLDEPPRRVVNPQPSVIEFKVHGTSGRADLRGGACSREEVSPMVEVSRVSQELSSANSDSVLRTGQCR